jgi:hypothetical protein
MGRYGPGIIGSSGGNQRFLGQGHEFVNRDARMITLPISSDQVFDSRKDEEECQSHPRPPGRGDLETTNPPPRQSEYQIRGYQKQK